jgi:8-oxo-dGTP pyrophosphatase MutT (NUDIX family)
MVRLVKSAWWIIYYKDSNGDLRFLLIKRHALSGKIERVAPKWKIQSWETPAEAALREVSEEAGIPLNFLTVRHKVWSATIKWLEDRNGKFEKEVTYFLMKYEGDPDLVDVQLVEWYLWTYKWALLVDVLNLIYYKDIRELFRRWYNMLQDQAVKNDVKKDFLKKLEL